MPLECIREGCDNVTFERGYCSHSCKEADAHAAQYVRETTITQRRRR